MYSRVRTDGDFLVFYKINCFTRFGCGMILLATFTFMIFDKLYFALGGLLSRAKYIRTKTKQKIHRGGGGGEYGTKVVGNGSSYCSKFFDFGEI